MLHLEQQILRRERGQGKRNQISEQVVARPHWGNRRSYAVGVMVMGRGGPHWGNRKS